MEKATETMTMNAALDDRTAFFAAELRRKLGDNLSRLRLFGSRARGDHWEGSDYDFLVVLKKKDAHMVDAVREVEVDFLNHFDQLSASLVYNEAEWKRRKIFPIGVNVEREGVDI